MSFIQEKINEYEKAQCAYTVSDLEKILADKIFEKVKFDVEAAIKHGKSQTSGYFDQEAGDITVYQMSCSMDEYVKYSNTGLVMLSNLICPCWEHNKSKLEIRNAFDKKQEQISPLKIEAAVRKMTVDLGATNVAIYVRYCENYVAKVWKKTFFSGHYVEEQRKLGRYKIGYVVSW